MSGHSKWAQIKRQKGANDAKRGATFTKLSNAIAIAVRQGGGMADPSSNFRLRLAIDSAKAVNMPKENIERAIQRASGKDASVMEEAVYEGFGPGGIAIIVEAATDNKNRTSSDIANVFNKNGGNMGQPGSVSYQFNQLGQILVKKGTKSVDDVFLDAADSGAEDIEDQGEEVGVFTQASDLAKVREGLLSKGYEIVEAGIIRRANISVELDDDMMEKALAFVERLEDMDDVQHVYTNIA